MHRRVFAGLVVALAAAALPASAFAQSPQPLTITLQQTTPGPVLTRATVGYSVTVRNQGTAYYSDVQVRVSFPGSTWGIPASGVGTGCAFAGGGGAPTALITCAAGGLAPSASRSIAFQIAVPSRVVNARSQQFTITAGLDVNGTLPGTGGADATAIVLTEVQALPDLEPRASGFNMVTGGVDAVYTVRVRNYGDGLAVGALTRITFPRDVAFVGLEQSTFRNCSLAGAHVDCSDLVTTPGSEASVKVVVRPPAVSADSVMTLLTVTVDPDNRVRESNESNNTRSVIPTVRNVVDLGITGTLEIFDHRQGDRSLRALMCPGALGRNMTALLKIRNNGPMQSPAATVRVNWLSGRNIVNGGCSVGDCCVNGSCLRRPSTGSCPTPAYFYQAASVPPLPPGAEITLRAVAVGPIPGIGQNQVEWGSATLDPENRVNDPDRRNNTWVMHP